DPARIFDRLKEAAQAMVDFANARRPRQVAPLEARRVPIKIDDDGTGGAVGAFLRRDGSHAVQVTAATVAMDDRRYPNKRCELWFQVAGRAKAGLVNLSRLDRATRARLRQQLLAVTWELDPAGRRRVEPKEDTKEKIGRSPDDADAFHLSHYQMSSGLGIVNVPTPPNRPSDGRGPRPRR
ncbi:MAG TPA: hypothetical protein VKD72_19250, partial [Gemmataceae bacterium]|nr:hypothetical protein [Gemmataceae bacterium]